MIKKIFVSLMAVSIFIPVFSVSANDVKSINPESDVVITELSNEQVTELYQRSNLKIPEKAESNVLGQIIQDLELYKTEEETGADGTIYKYDYYHVSYKDTKEAKTLQQNILRQNEPHTDLISPKGFGNEEGDVRIVTSFEPLVQQTKFDSVSKSLYGNLAAKSYQKYFSLLNGKYVSNYIANFFVGELLSDLVAGFEGSGDATAYFRLAKKTGQVYHNGSFKSYFETLQQEWYWKHEAITYNKDGSVKHAATTYYLPVSSGTSYLPINWVYSNSFYNNTNILETTQYQYSVEPNRSSPLSDFLKYEGYRNDWKSPGTMSY